MSYESEFSAMGPDGIVSEDKMTRLPIPRSIIDYVEREFGIELPVEFLWNMMITGKQFRETIINGNVKILQYKNRKLTALSLDEFELIKKKFVSDPNFILRWMGIPMVRGGMCGDRRTTYNLTKIMTMAHSVDSEFSTAQAFYLRVFPDMGRDMTKLTGIQNPIEAAYSLLIDGLVLFDQQRKKPIVLSLI